jgi:hypothetical protein
MALPAHDKNDTHGPRRTIRGGKRPAVAKTMAGTQVMCMGRLASRLFFAQSSALITYGFSLIPGTTIRKSQ